MESIRVNFREVKMAENFLEWSARELECHEAYVRALGLLRGEFIRLDVGQAEVNQDQRYLSDAHLLKTVILRDG